MQRWGDGRDLYARPTGRVRKLLADANEDGAIMMGWTETYTSGDELRHYGGTWRREDGIRRQREGTSRRAVRTEAA